MAGPKRTLGYPTRTAAVAALRAQNKSTEEIADALGISMGAVTGLEHSATRKRIRSGPTPDGRAMLLPARILAGLERHAARRGITPNHLARTIVEKAIEDKLIDAILDDAEELLDA